MASSTVSLGDCLKNGYVVYTLGEHYCLCASTQCRDGRTRGRLRTIVQQVNGSYDEQQRYDKRPNAAASVLKDIMAAPWLAVHIVICVIVGPQRRAVE